MEEANGTTSDSGPVLCREKQYRELLQILGRSPSDESPLALFVHGETCTGKSLVLEEYLKTVNYTNAYMHCAETANIKSCYEDIINQFSGHTPSVENNFQPYAKCKNLYEFVVELQKIKDKLSGGVNYIIIDHCEYLVDSPSNSLIIGFLRIQELIDITICPIFISTLPWSFFCFETYVNQPITVFFPQYTQHELSIILQNEKPPDVSKAFFDNFTAIFRGVFFNATKNIRELKFKLNICFEHYYEPVKSGSLTEFDKTQLWRRSQNFFKCMLKSVYINTSDPEPTNDLTIQLSLHSKYLLIASYIASYNPASEDKRFFVKNARKQRKSKKPSAKKLQMMIGPKCFSLERLLAITTAILDNESFEINGLIYPQITTLQEMKFLTRLSEDPLDNPIYKCNIDFSFAELIAKNVNFPIRQYLVDFL